MARPPVGVLCSRSFENADRPTKDVCRCAESPHLWGEGEQFPRRIELVNTSTWARDVRRLGCSGQSRPKMHSPWAEPEAHHPKRRRGDDKVSIPFPLVGRSKQQTPAVLRTAKPFIRDGFIEAMTRVDPKRADG